MYCTMENDRHTVIQNEVVFCVMAVETPSSLTVAESQGLPVSLGEGAKVTTKWKLLFGEVGTD